MWSRKKWHRFTSRWSCCSPVRFSSCRQWLGHLPKLCVPLTAACTKALEDQVWSQSWWLTTCTTALYHIQIQKLESYWPLSLAESACVLDCKVMSDRAGYYVCNKTMPKWINSLNLILFTSKPCASGCKSRHTSPKCSQKMVCALGHSYYADVWCASVPFTYRFNSDKLFEAMKWGGDVMTDRESNLWLSGAGVHAVLTAVHTPSAVTSRNWHWLCLGYYGLIFAQW